MGWKKIRSGAVPANSQYARMYIRRVLRPPGPERYHDPSWRLLSVCSGTFTLHA
jgi:hypothetical protein